MFLARVQSSARRLFAHCKEGFRSSRLTHERLTYDDLLRIVELIKKAEQFSEFRLKVGDIELELRRNNAHPGHTAPVESGGPPVAAPDLGQPLAGTSPHGEIGRPPEPSPSFAGDALIVRSPMVGTFYRAPEPGARPFVEVGDTVGADTIVCIIEVMKLMNSIAADARGTVTHILVADGAGVEPGQPLIVLHPNTDWR